VLSRAFGPDIINFRWGGWRENFEWPAKIENLDIFKYDDTNTLSYRSCLESPDKHSSHFILEYQAPLKQDAQSTDS